MSGAEQVRVTGGLIQTCSEDEVRGLADGRVVVLQTERRQATAGRRAFPSAEVGKDAGWGEWEMRLFDSPEEISSGSGVDSLKFGRGLAWSANLEPQFSPVLLPAGHTVCTCTC